MHNWLQHIKTNNAFARRDYWVAASASLFWVILTPVFVHRCLTLPDTLFWCTVGILFHSAVALIALTNTRLATGVLLIPTVDAVTDLWRSLVDGKPVWSYDVVSGLVWGQLFAVLLIGHLFAERRSQHEGGTP